LKWQISCRILRATKHFLCLKNMLYFKMLQAAESLSRHDECQARVKKKQNTDIVTSFIRILRDPIVSITKITNQGCYSSHLAMATDMIHRSQLVLAESRKVTSMMKCKPVFTSLLVGDNNDLKSDTLTTSQRLSLLLSARVNL
jgi:hypothetical protein